jgi:hypothetical protein
MQVRAWLWHIYHCEPWFSIASVSLLAAIPAVVVALLCHRYLKRSKIEMRRALTALEEQLRPVLSIEKKDPDLGWRAPSQRLIVRNTGEGAAFKTTVELFRGAFDQSLGTYFGFEPYVLPPRQSIELAFPTYGAYSLMLVYESATTDRFCTSVSFPDGEARVAYQQNTTHQVNSQPLFVNTTTRSKEPLVNGPLL